MKTLHPKVLEYKRCSAPIHFSGMEIDSSGILTEQYPGSDFDKRVAAGYGVSWQNRNSHGEKFVKGSASKSINDRGPNSGAKQPIKMLNFHNQSQPLTLFERLEENDVGLYFRSNPFDDVPWADYTLIQLRSGTINNFSIGWKPVWDKIEYDEESDSIMILEMELFEISPVSLASDKMTYALRGEQAILDFNDEIEYFIRCLPRANQLEARNLFARQKSLLETEPLDALDKPKPIKRAIDYNYLLKNFKE